MFGSSVWSGDVVKGPLGIMEEKPLCLRLHRWYCSLDSPWTWCSDDHSASVEEVLPVLVTSDA